jgi:hypothetical protein
MIFPMSTRFDAERTTARQFFNWHWFCLLLRADASGQPSGHRDTVEQKAIESEESPLSFLPRSG